VEQAENAEGKAPEAHEAPEALGGRSFPDVHGDFWEAPVFFMAAVGHDKTLSLSARANVIYSLGVIAGVNEMLLKAYFFGSAEGALDKPENIKGYTGIMSKLVALYKAYKDGGRISAADLVEAVEDIELEFFDFAREIMIQAKHGR